MNPIKQQSDLDLNQPTQKADRVGDYDFEPIKGYPMLNWRGRRPFTSTHYYPAQLKEVHGDEVDGWRNKIYWGDNLQVMSHLLKEFRGKVDLIYIDPPFDSKADYKITIRKKELTIRNDIDVFEEKQYMDIWNNDEYLQFMYERLIISREFLSSKGSIYLHTGWQKIHHLRCLLDEVFGNFKNQIIWQKIRVVKAQSASFGNVHDLILCYSKTTKNKFFQQYKVQDPDYEKKFDRVEESTGRRYQLVSLIQAGDGPPRYFGEQLLYPGPGRHWIWSQEKINQSLHDGLIEFTSNGTPRKKQYLDENKGKIIDDIWIDIFPVNSQAIEDTEYPTQKPESLLERIIRASTEPMDIVFDFFMGSGTTQAVAMKLGRRFIGADINLGAVQITTKRLLKVAEELKKQPLDANERHYTGFEVYNVNHYDVFRNPVQARELLLEALEINPLDQGAVFDGEKDGRMVKIMPVDRIATRADLSPLIAGLDYKSFERHQREHPTQPVEKITLVCMGHEPDLKAHLLKEVKPYLLDVEVVDILRDKADLQFKRDSEARVTLQNGDLVIDRFYPMNLLQKLSLQKETVGDWRELVESILIDWNYDGAVLQPVVVDIPGKNELVAGRYQVPPDAGTIRVKITDLLAESWEGSIEHG